MTRRDPFQQALNALTTFAGDGRFAWGEPLVATALAQELGLSPTPVREALARLSGEGLIDHRPGRGYFAPSLGVADLVDLLEQHRRLIHWALDVIERDALPQPLGPIDGASGERVFAAISRASERPVIIRAHWRVALQLRPARGVQPAFSVWDVDWARRLQPLLIACELTAIREEVDRYHVYSKDAAPVAIRELQKAARSIAQI